ncbi:putative dynein light chain, type protein [Helianthus debilis subsp. tardiflorus]
MTTHKKGVMYVYKLDTGNHQPEPHHRPSPPPRTATAKKTITHTLGALFNRSKTYRETNHHHNSNKQDTQKVVFDGGRRSVPAVKESEKLVSMIEKGRKTVSGTGEGRKPAVAGRRSAENRAEMVMVDVGMVAELLGVRRVLVTDMPGFMQVHAFRCARQSLSSLERISPKQVAFNIKKVCTFFMLHIDLLMHNVQLCIYFYSRVKCHFNFSFLVCSFYQFSPKFHFSPMDPKMFHHCHFSPLG